MTETKKGQLRWIIMAGGGRVLVVDESHLDPKDISYKQLQGSVDACS